MVSALARKARGPGSIPGPGLNFSISNIGNSHKEFVPAGQRGKRRPTTQWY